MTFKSRTNKLLSLILNNNTLTLTKLNNIAITQKSEKSYTSTAKELNTMVLMAS